MAYDDDLDDIDDDDDDLDGDESGDHDDAVSALQLAHDVIAGCSGVRCSAENL
ncbi:hypothetical protein [Mycobacterium sp. 852002-51057_SCH5723018]|uniref:hypothetical protein n=1 Tax=Mycobacterium sp. 852002-51057_SCH5723018 TaxID=1834094 RepID=UPI000B01B382|nr:hypothetical protein [Mycobacterium sp. 852002-51057_SCH5723018]